MVHLASNSFTKALLRQTFAYLLMMVMTVVFQPSPYHSNTVDATGDFASEESGAAVALTVGHSLPDTSPDQVWRAPLDSRPLTQVESGVDKVNHWVMSAPTLSSFASPSASHAASSGEPHFDAMISVEPDHPCYNFTVGNEKLQEFYSPGYPNQYPNKTECERVIRAPHGYTIIIEFRDQFHLEESTNCEYDFLEIRDGAYGYSTPLFKLCGADFPHDVTSNDRYIFLRFVSDDSIEYNGFKAVYKFIKMENQRPLPPHDCRFNVTGPSGFIRETDIPQNLSEYSIQQNVAIDCIWNITVAPGRKLYINFKEYRLYQPNNCELNYIDIYRDKLSDGARAHRFCGTQAEPVRSDTNHLSIRFFSQPEASKRAATPLGFEIIFTAFREVFHKEKCFENEFDCEDSTCIDISLRCNGVDNCKYRYDEDKTNTCDKENKGMLNLNSQHMVVILIVFCALVFGMCASIAISCWSKIEERRQRKREYKLRRSREASMEVGLDRTMTITSLDRSATGCALDHVEQASTSSGSRCRKIVTANAIRHKPAGHPNEIVDDNVIDGPSMAYYDSEENGCYVPDIDLASMHHHPSSTHHHMVYPPSSERRIKGAPGQPNGGNLCAAHHMNPRDKYSPDTPTPPQMMIGSPGGGPGHQVAGDYYPSAVQQNQMERDSIRSGSDCSIPPPPPPPSLSQFRNRLQHQFQTLPLDASKLTDSGIMIMGDNHQLYRHPQHMGPARMGSGPITLSQQQLILHHPDCAQHKMQQHNSDPVYNPNSLRRNYYTNRVADNSGHNSRPSSMPDTGEMLNEDIDEVGCMLDEGDESGVGHSEHQLNDEVLDEDVLTDNDIYPSSVKAPHSHSGHYLMRAQSTLDEEDDSSVPLNSSNSNQGYGSQMTPGHHRQPYFRSEAVIEMGSTSGENGTLNGGGQLRQGMAIMR